MFTDANALHGIREIVEWLPKSYAGDHEARQHMHEAQCIAGIAFSSGLLGIVHSMAHKTGAAFENGHIIHGAANAKQDACTPENPRETNAADFEKILKACYYDTDIDF